MGESLKKRCSGPCKVNGRYRLKNLTGSSTKNKNQLKGGANKTGFNSIHITTILKGKYTSMHSPEIKTFQNSFTNIGSNLASFATNHYNQPITSSPLECHH